MFGGHITKDLDVVCRLRWDQSPAENSHDNGSPPAYGGDPDDVSQFEEPTGDLGSAVGDFVYI